MSFEDKTGEVSQMNEAKSSGDELTPELDQAIREFRLSVHAWSAAAMNRPRTMLAAAPPRRIWRLAAGWALSAVLLIGGLSAGVFEHHRQQMKLAQARIAEQQRLEAAQKLKQARQADEDLLAKVDSDVSQAVPSAMEPLAQLMTGDVTR